MPWPTACSPASANCSAVAEILSSAVPHPMNRRAAAPLLDELLATLRAEQEALRRDDADALPRLAEAKARTLEQIVITLRGASGEERAELATAIATAQRANEVNGALVAARMSAQRAQLDVLMTLAGHGPAAATYGVRGEISPTAARRHGSAASFA